MTTAPKKRLTWFCREVDSWVENLAIDELPEVGNICATRYPVVGNKRDERVEILNHKPFMVTKVGKKLEGYAMVLAWFQVVYEDDVVTLYVQDKNEFNLFYRILEE